MGACNETVTHFDLQIWFSYSQEMEFLICMLSLPHKIWKIMKNYKKFNNPVGRPNRPVLGRIGHFGYGHLNMVQTKFLIPTFKILRYNWLIFHHFPNFWPVLGILKLRLISPKPLDIWSKYLGDQNISLWVSNGREKGQIQNWPYTEHTTLLLISSVKTIFYVAYCFPLKKVVKWAYTTVYYVIAKTRSSK